MAVVLWLLAVGLLIISVLFDGDPTSTWSQLLAVAASWAGPILLVLALVFSVRTWLTKLLRRQIVDLAGPAMIRSMPPRTVLGALLPWVYGDRTDYREVLTGVLGGAGRDAEGRDTAVSRRTTAVFRLHAIDQSTCRSDTTWTHEFSGVRNNHRFVIFATCDRDISTYITGERVFPPFELWVLNDEDQLEDFVPNLRDTLKIGISYLDVNGVMHHAEPRSPYGEEVALRHYDQFVRLPDWIDRKDLRIIQFDLHDLADPDHVVASVESLSFRASAFLPFDLGFFTWSPPHPCFVHEIVFDVEGLAAGGEELAYLVLPSTMRKHSFPQSRGWVRVSDRFSLTLDAWMLPGHGVTLLWRPANGSEPHDRPHSW
jgi:hypothetical protein